MRLVDLEPHWLTFDGRRVGFIFRSPADANWWQTCFVESFQMFSGQLPLADPEDFGTPDSQDGIVKASAPHVGGQWQGCNPDHCWQVAGGIEAASFDTMTVTPSLDGSRGGLWHGFITAGAIA